MHNLPQTLGIYAEVIQRWLGDITQIAAQGEIIYPIRGGYRVKIPDTLRVDCQIGDGIGGRLEFSGVHTGPAEDCIEIEGDRATLFYDYLADAISLRHPGQIEAVPIPDEMARPWTVELDFVRAVRGDGPPPEPGFEEGVRYMRVVEEVQKSLGFGRPMIP